MQPLWYAICPQRNIRKHTETVHQGKSYECHFCHESFKSEYILNGHITFTHEGKKVGNAKRVKLNSKPNIRSTTTLKRFMKGDGTIFVSYVEKHLCACLTWTLIWNRFMKTPISGTNVKPVKKATNQNKLWPATLNRLMKETSRLLSVLFVTRHLWVRILWNVTLKLFMRRKSRLPVIFVRLDLGKSLIWLHI